MRTIIIEQESIIYKKNKMFFAVLFIAVLFVAIVFCFALCNGQKGWSFSNGELVISSSSLKTESFKYEQSPWHNIRKKITKITFKEDVVNIPGWSFIGCINLKRVFIPNQVKSIGSKAFSNCKSLEDIRIPDKIDLCTDTFMNTKWYNEQPEGVLVLNNYVLGYKGKGKKELRIKEGSKYIIENAFEGNNNISQVFIPNSVIDIGAFAFYSCNNLKELKIGKNVQKIGYYAFCGTNLHKIIIKNKITKIDNDAFGDYTNKKEMLHKDCVIYCYRNSTFFKYAQKNGIKIKEWK